MTAADNNLKIAMIGQKEIPSREGGVEVVVEELSTRMASMGHSVTCFNSSANNNKEKKTCEPRSEYKGVRLKRVFTIKGRGITAMTSSISASFSAAFGRFDVVHFHAEGPAFMCWLPKLFGKRVIVTIHGLDHKRAKWKKLARFCILMGEKNAVRYADEIIVLSENLQRYFMDEYGRTTVLIPNGVTPQQHRSNEQIEQNWGLKKNSYILFLGRLVPEKGIKYLISAYKRLKTDKLLVIAGGSSDTDEFCRELYELAAGDERIIFTGFVQGRILEELYSNAYIYCLPSDLEGMPMTLLEAMSYGNCCVVSDIPECSEVVADKGLTFPAGDVDELARVLQTLCDRPEITEEYKSNSAKYICGLHKWEDVVEQTIALYRG